jgi:hypothetical protein
MVPIHFELIHDQAVFYILFGKPKFNRKLQIPVWSCTRFFRIPVSGEFIIHRKLAVTDKFPLAGTASEIR